MKTQQGASIPFFFDILLPKTREEMSYSIFRPEGEKIDSLFSDSRKFQSKFYYFNTNLDTASASNSFHLHIVLPEDSKTEIACLIRVNTHTSFIFYSEPS